MKDSYASTANAQTIMPDPNMLHIVRVSMALPNMRSEMMTRTIVSRLPTDVTIGPHTPRRI